MNTSPNRYHADTPVSTSTLAHPASGPAAVSETSGTTDDGLDDEVDEFAASTLRAVPAARAEAGTRAVQVAGTAGFEALSAAGELTAIRAYSSFDYAVSLALQVRTFEYFITLRQHDALWKVFKTTNFDTATAAFQQLQARATRLSGAEIHRREIAAQNDFLRRQIEELQSQSEQWRIERQRRGEQDRLALARQQQAHQENTQLEAQRLALRAQLEKVQRQNRQLTMNGNELVRQAFGRRS
jgi:hypothetical protein